jgi:hypothetical protein
MIKGLEVIRREWSQLSKIVGKLLLNIVLSSDENFVEKVYSVVKKVSELLNSEKLNKQVLPPEYANEARFENLDNFLSMELLPLSFLKMHMMLNKAPSEYDVKTLAFVNVAKRLQARKKLKDSQMLNKVIPYLICQGPTGTKPFDRAYHPEEYYESGLSPSEGG